MTPRLQRLRAIAFALLIIGLLLWGVYVVFVQPTAPYPWHPDP